MFDNTPFHTCSTWYAILQCTALSNITITSDIYMKMCLYICNGMQTKRKRVDLSSVLHMHVHVYAHKEELSHRIMIDRLGNIITKLRREMDIICLLGLNHFKFYHIYVYIHSLTLYNRFRILTFNSPVKLLFGFFCRATKHFHIKHHLIYMTVKKGVKIFISFSTYVRY